MTIPNGTRSRQLLDRVQRLLDVRNDKSRRTIALFATAVFAVGLVISARRLGGVSLALSATALVGMFALLCLTFMVNALRTHAHSRIVGARLNFADNAKISLFGSAMNMLPLIIPAGMLMRMSNFVQHGGETRQVVSVLLSNYVVALTSSLLLGIGMLAASAPGQLHAALSLVALVYVASLAVFVRISGTQYGIGIGVLELAGVGIDAVRIFLCFGILGFDIEMFQAAILTVSAILGSAVSIVPAGLGVRELVGALISPLIGVLPAQAFLAIALNRLFGMLFFVGLSGLVLFSDRGKPQ